MRRRNLSHVLKGYFTGLWSDQMLYGILFVLFGALIIVFPRILAAVVASVFFLIGFFLISSAWTFRTMAQCAQDSVDELFDRG